MSQPAETPATIEAGANLTPLPSGPVQIERAWHYFMRQIAIVNVGYAHGVKVQRRALRAWMGSR